METAKSKSYRVHPRDSSFVSVLAGLAQRSVQSLFVFPRRLLDIAIGQNGKIMHSIRQQFSDPSHTRTALIGEVAGEGITHFIQAQKVLLELGLKENEILMAGVKERLGERPAAHALADLVRRSVETFIHLQKQFLTIAGKQTHTWVEAAKTGKLYQSEPLVRLAREGLETYVKAQLQLMDIIADELAKATSGKRAYGVKKIKKTELTALVREAAESFIDAQRKLLDLAGKQMNANVKTAGKALEVLKPFPLRPLEELTSEGVKTYLDAQEALMDFIVKPATEHKHGAKAKRRAKRPAHVHKEKMAAAVA